MHECFGKTFSAVYSAMRPFFSKIWKNFLPLYVYGHHAAIRRARPRAASSTGTGRKNSCNRTASAAKSRVIYHIEAAASILYGPYSP